MSLADDKVFRMFLAEYVKVCGTKKFDAKDVKEQLSVHLATKIGRDLNQFIAEDMFDALCRVVQSGRNFNRDDLLMLSDWLGEDATRYFMLDAFEDDVWRRGNRASQAGTYHPPQMRFLPCEVQADRHTRPGVR